MRSGLRAMDLHGERTDRGPAEGDVFRDGRPAGVRDVDHRGDSGTVSVERIEFVQQSDPSRILRGVRRHTESQPASQIGQPVGSRSERAESELDESVDQFELQRHEVG